MAAQKWFPAALPSCKKSCGCGQEIRRAAYGRGPMPGKMLVLRLAGWGHLATLPLEKLRDSLACWWPWCSPTSSGPEPSSSAQ